MEQIERIQKMEEKLNRVSEAVGNLRKAAEAYDEIYEDIKTLAEYYESPLWMQDYQDDEDGKIPENLRRGVLSEDGIDSLLQENDELMELLTDSLPDWCEREICG